MRIRSRHIFLLLIAFGLLPNAAGQERIDKEIVVVKPYQPSLSDAYKINILPDISDSISIKPSFDYSIEPVKFDTRFQVRPITPARLVGIPLAKLYKSYLKLGFGNYLAPVAELNVNSLRSKTSQWGLSLNHYSINGKLKLENGRKVSPGFFENSGSIYGKKVLKKSWLSGSIHAAYDGSNFYGYHPSLDTVLLKDNIKQNFLKAGAGIRMGSMRRDSLKINWTGYLDYNLIRDYYSNLEHTVRFRAEGNERISSGQTAGLNVGAAYYYTSPSIDSGNMVIAELNPWFGKTTQEYTYRLGIGIAVDGHTDKTTPHFFPEGLLQINMVRGILMPYFGFDGGLQVNNYGTIVDENPYIIPGLRVKNTAHKIRGYAGVKGSWSKNLSYDLSGSYSVISNMPFFVNDGSDGLYNKFNVAYDNLQLIRGHAEINFKQAERLRSLLTVTYDHYTLESLQKPWHKPNLIISLDEEYNLKDKIIVNGGIYYMGKRYAPQTLPDPDIVELKGFADVSIGLEYRYTKILSGFIRFNNILGTRYQTWNNYPGMGFNAIFGFTYAL